MFLVALHKELVRCSSDDGIKLIKQSSISNVGGHFQTLYEQTPIEQIQEKHDNEEFVITKMHYYNTKKEWCANGYTYKYRLEITGRMNNAAKDSTYIVLSNKENITFAQTWKASGLSSLSTDYFKPKDAVIVGYKL